MNELNNIIREDHGKENDNYNSLSAEQKLVVQILNIVDSQKELTPEFTSSLLELCRSFYQLYDLGGTMVDIDEYIATLNDVTHGNDTDIDWVPEFRKALIKDHLPEELWNKF